MHSFNSYFQSLSNYIFTRGQFWPSGIVVACVCVCICVSISVCVCQLLACPRDNSGPVQDRITKFWPKMQKTLVKVPIVLWTDRPWSSRSNLTWKSKFTPFWACPCHNSPPNKVTISKFGTKVHLSTVQIPTNFGLDWNWSSIQFLISNPDQIELFMYIIGIL